MKNIAVWLPFFLLLFLSVASFYMHMRMRWKRSLPTYRRSAYHKHSKHDSSSLKELATFLPERLCQLYQDDLLNVSQSPRHTVIACQLIVKEIARSYYPNLQLTLTGLAEKLLAEGYVTREVLYLAKALDKQLCPSKGDVEHRAFARCAQQFTSYIFLLLYLLYVTPQEFEKIRVELK